MSTNPSEKNVPILDKDEATNEWVLKVQCAAPVRVPIEQRALACQMWEAATRAYHNGRWDVQKEMHRALGIPT